MSVNANKPLKCVQSMRIARTLLSQGFPLIDVQPGRKHNTLMVFVFEDTPELNEAFTKIVENGGATNGKTNSTRKSKRK